MSSKIIFAIIFCVGVNMLEVGSIRVSLSGLDSFQLNLVKEFRKQAEKALPLEEFMKDESYLLRFLSAKKFNLEEATSLLQENLEWRRNEKIDGILEEDWTDMEKRFPYEINGVTKEGLPILYYHFGKWDFSEEVASGDFQRLLRYSTAKVMEDADRKVRSLKRGDNDVSQFDVIVNANGFTKENHGCTQCLQFYKDSNRMSEFQYVGAINKVFIVNSSPDFEATYSSISNSFSETRLKSTVILGDRDEYKPVLLEIIDETQIPQDLQ